MTVHAGLRRRHPCKPRGLDRRVAVTTVNPVIRDMMLVAEGNGLTARNARFGHVRRAPDRYHHPGKPGENKDEAEDANASNRIGAAVKCTAHRGQFPFRPSGRD